jgi:hypothetical protein
MQLKLEHVWSFEMHYITAFWNAACIFGVESILKMEAAFSSETDTQLPNYMASHPSSP